MILGCKKHGKQTLRINSVNIKESKNVILLGITIKQQIDQVYSVKKS